MFDFATEFAVLGRFFIFLIFLFSIIFLLVADFINSDGGGNIGEGALAVGDAGFTY